MIRQDLERLERKTRGRRPKPRGWLHVRIIREDVAGNRSEPQDAPDYKPGPPGLPEVPLDIIVVTTKGPIKDIEAMTDEEVEAEVRRLEAMKGIRA